MASLFKRKDSPFYWIRYTPIEQGLLGLTAGAESTQKKSKRQAEIVLKEKAVSL